MFDKGKALAVFTAEETNPKAEFLEKDVSKVCAEGKSGYMLTCEKKLGRPLSLTEIEIFSNMRDWIGLDEDVIFTLIDYCKAKGKARIKYMEKVALDWHEKGIASQDAALEYIHMMEYEFTDILKALGKAGFSPTKTDEKYFTKWLKEMEMPLDIVLAACEKTVETTGKPGLKYADKILENWKSEGVKTKDDIDRLDAIFKESKEKPGNNPPQKNYAGGGKNRFVNFPQRQWNFDEIANGEEKRHKNNS